MSVKVELEFKSVDEAIVALGKLVGTAVASPKDVKAASVAPSTPPVPATPRRGPGRPPKDANVAVEAGTKGSAVGSGAADTAAAGKQAGAGKTTTQVVNPQSTPPAAAPAPIAAPAAPVAQAQEAQRAEPAPPAAATPTADDVQKAVEVLFTAKGYDTTLALLKDKYGVSRGKDVDPAQRANFIREANEAAKL